MFSWWSVLELYDKVVIVATCGAWVLLCALVASLWKDIDEMYVEFKKCMRK